MAELCDIMERDSMHGNQEDDAPFDLRSSPPPNGQFERTNLLDLSYGNDRNVVIKVDERSLTGKDTVFFDIYRSDPSNNGSFVLHDTWEPQPFLGLPKPSSKTTTAARIDARLKKGYGVFVRGSLVIRS